MSAYLASIASWGPTVYYSFGVANTLAMPSIIKHLSGPSSLAKDVLPEVFEKVENLRKDIVIYRVQNLPYAVALGTNFGPAAVLMINDELALTDDEALNFICKHELSHIKTSDGFTASSLATVASAISTYAVPFLESFLPWWAAPISYCVPFLIGANVYTLAMGIFEHRADSFASRHATSDELVGIERFVRAQIEVNKTLEPKYPQLFAKDGNSRLALGDNTHSPLTMRLKEIRQECRLRNIVIEEGAEAEKMQQVKVFHQNTYKNFSKLKVD